MTVKIHPTAIVEQGVELDTDVEVGPYCIIGPKVKIGKNTKLHSHVVIQGCTQIGERNEVFPFASIGNAPQDLKYRGEQTHLLIGNENKIREYATLQPGTVQGGNKTIVGDQNLLMAYTHVAHDCIVGSRNVFANGAQLAGHVVVDDGTVIGALTGVHQFARIGSFAMSGAGSMISQDVPPYCTVQGDRAVLRGLNVVGLKRFGFTKTMLDQVKDVYHILFLSPDTASSVEAALQKCVDKGFDKIPELNRLLTFVRQSKRGVVRPAQGESKEEVG